MMVPTFLHNCPAPAKLNLFLHVTGRRADGYHMLQSVFQLLDHGDTLHIDVRNDDVLRRTTEVPGVPESSDLIIRAAHLLQMEAARRFPGKQFGADMAIDKRLPMGGGLGGGSSDAATTLLALNYLWQTGLNRQELMALGLKLGADVPFFLFGRNAFAEYQVPEAVLALKQGFGRLIRSKTDRGILAILDNRISRMQYGRIFLESLPDYTTTQDLAEVARFMENHPD